MNEPISVSKDLMGSPFTINVYPDGRFMPLERLNVIIELAFAEIKRVEDLLTDFRQSPFNDINENAGISRVQVTQEIIDLIEFARQVSDDSFGAFDISYAAIGHLWRKAFMEGVPPQDGEIARAKELVDYRKIEVNQAAKEVYLSQKGMRIGLGSLGKSYGVDMAFSLMRTFGVKNFFINGAGDIRVHCSVDAPRPWNIGIKNPFNSAGLPKGVISLSQGAVVTSGDYERFMVYKGKKYHHIIDARTGANRNDVASVTVLAPTAVTANAYATAAMALGLSDGMEFLQRRRTARGLIIAASGEVLNCGITEKELVLKETESNLNVKY